MACSAGTSPKNTVERSASDQKHSTRQSAAGAPKVSCSASSGGIVAVTAVSCTLQKQPRDGKPACSRCERSKRFSVSSCRMIRRRDAPSDSRMPISRWRENRARVQVGDVRAPKHQDQPEGKEDGEKTQRLARIVRGMSPGSVSA